MEAAEILEYDIHLFDNDLRTTHTNLYKQGVLIAQHSVYFVYWMWVSLAQASLPYSSLPPSTAPGHPTTLGGFSY